MAPTPTVTPTVVIAGDWYATEDQHRCQDFLISITQTGQTFEGRSSTPYGTGRTDVIRLEGTIIAKTLIGRFSETIDFFGTVECQDIGGFQGSVLSASNMNISVPTVTSSPMACCGVGRSMSLTRR